LPRDPEQSAWFPGPGWPPGGVQRYNGRMADRGYRFVASVRVDEIAAAHFLPGYPGDCARVHGHNWSFEAEIGADVLHEDMVVDFVAVKAVFKALDHSLLNDDPELGCGGRRPTTERLAEVLAGRVQAALDGLPNRPRLLALTVIETSRNRITYRPSEA
jgi:6-pyruvoyltetrahydropterin/6-carboxytetrahydropterin synthase